MPNPLQIERQRAALVSVETEAEEESTINRELANVMCARLDAARRATERLLGVLQVCDPSCCHSSKAIVNAAHIFFCDIAGLLSVMGRLSRLFNNQQH